MIIIPKTTQTFLGDGLVLHCGREWKIEESPSGWQALKMPPLPSSDVIAEVRQAAGRDGVAGTALDARVAALLAGGR